MASVDPPISSSDITNVLLRPTRSPKWPKAIAPKGRATKASPNTIKALITCAPGEALGKNSGPNTSAVAVAKT